VSVAVLDVEDLNVFYDKFQALHDVSVSVDDGSVVVLLGRNGTGKTTTMKSIMGMLEPASGSIRFEGEDIVGRDPHEVARAGVSFVPDGRRLMPQLSVYENLRLGYIGHGQADPIEKRLDAVYDYFPRLREKRDRNAAAMSGGEQQMLAIGRGLMADPDLLLVDEPIEGLMPKFVDTIERILRQLNDQGLAMMVIEHDLTFAFDIADYVYVIYEGGVVAEGPSEAIRDDEEVKRSYLSV
jgi:branched-chain amino acid transport system ATP-binding protein